MITIKDKAKKLRRKGYSFREISEYFSISKSTASLWTRNEILSKRAKNRIKKLGDKGRKRGKQTKLKKREQIWDEIDKNCNVLRNNNYNIEHYKLILASLYWGEGAKQNYIVNFINSDPFMIKLYLNLLRACYNIDEKKFRVRIHLHDYHNEEEMVSFWSKVTGIGKNQFSIYNKPHTGKNKKPNYKGCLSIRYGDSRIIKEIQIIINRLKRFNIAGLV